MCLEKTQFAIINKENYQNLSILVKEIVNKKYQNFMFKHMYDDMNKQYQDGILYRNYLLTFLNGEVITE